MAKEKKSSLLWKLLGLGFAIPAGIGARKALDAGWERARGSTPPKNPAAPGTDWLEALAWATVSGLIIAFARLVAARGAAATYKSLTGKLPPGLEDDGPL